jgi:PAS domain S-box-containing protein
MSGNGPDLAHHIRAVRKQLDLLRARIEACGEGRSKLREGLNALSESLEDLHGAGRAVLRQSEMAHRESLRYRTLFELAPAGHIVTDGRGVIQDANHAAVALLQAPRDELVGRQLIDFLAGDPTERRTLDRKLAQLAGSDRAQSWEMSLRPPDGEALRAALSLNAVRETDGTISGVQWLIRDVTERRKAEGEREELLRQVDREREQAQRWAEETHSANRLLRAVIDTMPVGVVISDAEGAILMTNHVGREIFGTVVVGSAAGDRRGYALHRPDGSPLPDEEMPLRVALEQGEAVANLELLIHREDGSERLILAGAAPVVDADGRITSGVMAFQDITPRRQAEHERDRSIAQAEQAERQAGELTRILKRERDILQTLMENTPAQLAYLDPEFNFVRVNAAYAQGAGYTKEELIGRNHFELFPHAENQAIFERVRDTGRAATFYAKPFSHPRRPDVDKTYWDWTLVPVTDDAGTVQGLVFSLMDVTERERTRQVLRQYADRLEILHQIDRAILAARSVDDIAAAALFHLRRLVPCERASTAVFDLEAGQVSLIAVRTDAETGIGEGWHGPLGPPWDVETLQQGRIHTETDVEALAPASAKARALLAEGVRAHVSVPLIAYGDLIGALNLGLPEPTELTPQEADIVREVADELALSISQLRLFEQVQRHSEELEQRVARRAAALRASEARFRAIFEEAAVGIALLRSNNHIMAANPALQEILGYSEGELVGMTLAELAEGDHAGLDEDLYGKLATEGQRAYQTEERFVRKDGQTVWANLTLSLVRRAHSSSRFAVAMVEDITERKRAQTALLQAEKLALTGRLAASLAHEINNPLQSVIGCLGLARESLAEGQNAGEYLEVAHTELRRAARIVAQLRDLNRPSRPEDREPTDVTRLIDNVLLLSRNKCQSSGIEVVWEGTDGLPMIRVVPDRMQQVFLNLILNAVDAMPGGGRLQVEAAPTSDPVGVRITFTDDGEGIGAHILPHIFDPFYSTKPEGLGLGLFITHNIVEEHGGHIEVESKQMEGTSFTVWLPAPETA